MEVVIIMVVFNTFMTKEAEGAGLCGVWGASRKNLDSKTYLSTPTVVWALTEQKSRFFSDNM